MDFFILGRGRALVVSLDRRWDHSWWKHGHHESQISRCTVDVVVLQRNLLGQPFVNSHEISGLKGFAIPNNCRIHQWSSTGNVWPSMPWASPPGSSADQSYTTLHMPTKAPLDGIHGIHSENNSNWSLVMHLSYTGVPVQDTHTKGDQFQCLTLQYWRRYRKRAST